MADALVIRQLRGDRVELVLEDNDLPDDNVDVATTHRTAVTYVPGSTEAVVQGLGVTREPVTLRGEWDDGGTGNEGGALSLLARAQQIADDGIPVRVTWGDRWQWTAFVTGFTPSWFTSTRIGWALTLQPITTERTEDKGYTTRQRQTRADLEAAARNLLVSAVTTANVQAAAAASGRWIRFLT